jgi:hypothetical protein
MISILSPSAFLALDIDPLRIFFCPHGLHNHDFSVLSELLGVLCVKGFLAVPENA